MYLHTRACYKTYVVRTSTVCASSVHTLQCMLFKYIFTDMCGHLHVQINELGAACADWHWRTMHRGTRRHVFHQIID